LQEKGRLWLRGLAVVIVLAGLVAGAGLFPASLFEPIRSSAMRGLGIALVATLLAWMMGRTRRIPSFMLVAVAFVDLAPAVWSLQNFVSGDRLGAEPASARSILADAQARGLLAPPRVYRGENIDAAIALAAPPRSVMEVQRNLTATLIDNHAGCFGIANVPGYDAAMPSSLSALWLALRGRGLDLLRLTGVDYVVLPSSLPDTPGLVAMSMADPVPGARLFHVEGVLPRVYLAQPSATLPDALALASLLSPEVVAGRRVVLAPSNELPVSAAPDSTSDLGACRLVAFANSHVEAECEAKRESLAVFLEQYDPGWTASRDGGKVPLLRANLTMRAVPVPTGHHHIALDFSPPGQRVGQVVALVGLFVLLGLFILGRRRLS
jgi:Bacterial membrane protein YfhO